MPSPSYFDVVYLNPDRQAVVPCRVTVVSAKVTLHREFPAKEIPTNGTDIIYDLKRGFVYLQPHSDHQGVVYCKAEAGGQSQISVKYQLLYVEGKSVCFLPPTKIGAACWLGGKYKDVGWCSTGFSMAFLEHSAPLTHPLCPPLQMLPTSVFDWQVPCIPSLPLGLVSLSVLTKYLLASSSTSHLEDGILFVPNSTSVPCFVTL